MLKFYCNKNLVIREADSVFAWYSLSCGNGYRKLIGMRLSNRCYAVTGLGYSAPWCVNAGFIAGDEVTLVVDTGGNAAGGPDHSRIRFGGEAGEPTAGRQYGEAFRSHRRERLLSRAGDRRVGPSRDCADGRRVSSRNRGVQRRRFPTRLAAHAGKPALFSGTHLANPNRQIQRTPRFDLGGCTAEILLTPGHTPTNLSVWVPEDGVLFTGDCLISEYLPNLDAGTRTDWRTWLESLQRIEALQPAIVVPGHGPVVRDAGVRTVVDTVRRVLRESIERGCSPTAHRRA